MPSHSFRAAALHGFLALWTASSLASFAAASSPVLVSLANRTLGKAAATSLYLTVTAQDGDGKDQHMDRQGRFHPCLPADDTIPRNGTTWCTYSFPLGPSFSFRLEADPGWTGGRIYLSIGTPLLQRVDPTGVLNTPNLDNPQDPNTGTTFDWVEFALDGSGFHGNTTCVDQFGLPIVLEALDGSGAGLGPVGIEARRSDLLHSWASMPEPFRALLDPAGLRITAPGRAAPGPLDTYLDRHILALWEGYRMKPLVLTPADGTFTGRLDPGGALVFTRDGDATPYVIRSRPTTREVFRCDGTLAQGLPMEKLLGAQIAALLNRSLLQNPQAWKDEKLYYLGSSCNLYAAFWHRHGLGGRAYGFPYDDVNEQSTLIYSPDPREIHIRFRID